MGTMITVENKLLEVIYNREKLFDFIQLYLNTFANSEYFKYIHDILIDRYNEEDICEYFYQTLEKGIHAKQITPQLLNRKIACQFFFNKEFRGSVYINKFPLIFNSLYKSIDMIKDNYKNTIICDPIIKEKFDYLFNNKMPLIDAINFYKQYTNQKRYMEFIYKIIFPLYSIEEWELYIFDTIKKSIECGEIPFNNINMITISLYIFNANYMSSRWLKKYPLLHKLISNCVSKIRELGLDSLKKYKCVKPEVKDMFLYALKNKKPLIEAMKLYLEIQDNLCFDYIENTLVPEYNEDNFLKYIEDMITCLAEMENISTFQVKPSKVSKYIFNINCYSSKWRIRHPRLFNLIIKANDNKKYKVSIYDIKNKLNNSVQGIKVNEEVKKKINVNTKVIKRSMNSTSLKLKLNSIEQFSQKEIIEVSNYIIENEFVNKRIKLNKTQFYRLLSDESNISTQTLKTFKYYSVINNIFEEKYQEQRQYLIGSNINQLDLSKDIWVLYYEDGASLRSKTFDFSDIKSSTLKTELMLYIKNNYVYTNIYSLFHTFFNVKLVINLITEKFSIKHFSDFNSIHTSFILQCLQIEEYAIMSIKNKFGHLSKVTNYLMNLTDYSYKPKFNVFTQVSFHNASAMSKNTKYIPYEVIDQIESHIDEISPIHQLIYKIFSFTGMRAKEILMLEYDCCNPIEEYEGYIKLKYIPYKVLKVRRRHSLPDRSFVYIPYDLYEQIQKQCEDSKSLRKKYNMPYIFITENNGDVVLKGSTGFSRSINRLIEKYNICDLEGNQWNFTSKQMRKTLAVQLIEKNATPHQIANQFGHLSQETTEQFYIEVKMKKIAELNSEFFYKKFNFEVGEDNIKLYTEEERRQLYVDFCINKREVEFGQCTKHMSEGKCTKRIGKIRCATCSKLCTGIKYLDKWESLYNSQQSIVNELTETYYKHNINDYSDFKEYKREKYLLDCYTEVLKNIKSTNNKGGTP